MPRAILLETPDLVEFLLVEHVFEPDRVMPRRSVVNHKAFYTFLPIVSLTVSFFDPGSR